MTWSNTRKDFNHGAEPFNSSISRECLNLPKHLLPYQCNKIAVCPCRWSQKLKINVYASYSVMHRLTALEMWGFGFAGKSDTQHD